MTNYATSFDSTNNLYTITFTLTSSWGGNLGWYIGNYGRITSFIVAKPTLYLLDSSGNPTGSNYAVDFGDGKYCTSRTGDSWLKSGIYSNLVTFSEYNEDVFAPEIPQDTNPKMLKLGGAGGGMQALCYETKLTASTHYRFDVDYRGCGGASAYKSIEVINGSGKYETPSKENWTLDSRTDTGTHLTVCFRVPSNAESGKNHFRLYVGQSWPQKKNGVVYFANFSLRTADNGVAYGSNLFSNGDFHLNDYGDVTSSNKDSVFRDFEQVKVMTYPQVELLPIPENFFTDSTALNLDKAYKFKGGDLHKPQFDFQFAPSTTYQLKYNYSCDDNDTVNACIISKDNTVSANKVSRVGNGKFEATYNISTSADTNEYTDYNFANTNIRFALNGNSYNKPFYITNIRMYKTENGNPIGANLVYHLNPVFDDGAYGLSDTVTSASFELAKDDADYNCVKSDVACGWLGNLNFDGTNNDAYSNVEKIGNQHIFDYYDIPDRLTYLVNALLNKSSGYNPFNDQNSRFYDPNGDENTDILDLVNIKKSAANGEDKFTVTNEQTNAGIYDAFNTVTCWGDSITQGMNMAAGKSYPERLNSYIGNGYTVINSGDPGEKSHTIVARQGALSITTSKQFSFPSGTNQIVIGNQDDNGFVTSNGKYIDLTSTLGNQRSVNNITINGKEYQIILTNFVWSPRSYTVNLKQLDTSGSVTIPKGTVATLNNYTNAEECEIYYIGANGDYNDDRYNLIAQYKAMIDNHGSNNFMVLIPHFYYCPAEFRAAFGDHCVDFVKVACSDEGFNYEKISKTSKDTEYMSQNRIPPSFRLNNSETDVHLNEYGYDLVAHLIYEKGKKLNYFS